jgi:predicted GNAT family acetyltransferase
VPELKNFRISTMVQEWIEGHGFETILEDTDIIHTDLDNMRTIFKKRIE